MGKIFRIKKLKNAEKQIPGDIKQADAKHTFRLVRNTYIHILLIVLVGFLSYANTFNAPFQWDEGDFIVDNPIVKDMGFFTEPSKAHNLGELADFFTRR